MTVGSLFAGIGGFDLGFERAGFEVRWQVEIDPFARAVLAKHWPAVTRYEDIRDVRGADVEPVDVLCGGFPCQDISNAGRQAGIGGERSGLWSQFDRLIGELRPRYVVVENVSALLVRGLGRVLGDLAACGYDAEWDCLPASAFSAPHQRDRLWLVAYPNHRGPQKRWPEGATGVSGCGVGFKACPSVCAKTEKPSNCAFVADANGARQREQWRVFPARTELASAECRRWWGTEPHVGRVAHGIPARVDRLRGLGNAILPQIAEWIARRILEAEDSSVGRCGKAIGG